MRVRDAFVKRRARKHSGVSLRAHLVLYMLLFLGLVLMITWLFQVGLLDIVYEKVRAGDMEDAAEELSAAVGTGNPEMTAFEIAMREIINIRLYRINGGKAVEVLSQSTGLLDKSILGISPFRMSEIYKKASENDGALHLHLTFGGQEVERSVWTRLFPRGGVGSERDSSALNQAYVYLFRDEIGDDYMIFLYASLEPLSPMVNTLQRQFVWIFGILAVMTVLLAIIISKRIVRPVSHMNEAAKQLANGNYNADFRAEKGYRETRELAESLTYAAQELSRTDSLQKELIANISHDLRTPLTMIRGYGEAMRDIPGENTPENLQVLIDETEYLTELVNDLMDLSKLRAGVRCPTMEFFNLTAAVREVIARYEQFTKTQGYRIGFVCGEEVCVFADRGMILQVIYNLISNAINYTGADLSVTVLQSVCDGKVRISVQDTGEGIPEDQLPHIWDRYYKVDRVHRMAKIGTGLGLSIVKGALTAHNAGGEGALHNGEP